MNVEVNSNGVNKLLKGTILSDERMREIGFCKNYYEGTDHERVSSYWYFIRRIKFPDEERWNHVDITFQVDIPKDGSDINIMVIDEHFGQPYDYQHVLENYPANVCANIVKAQVEALMKYLQDNGVLSGHIYGDYI